MMNPYPCSKPLCLHDHEWRRLLLNNIDDLLHVLSVNGTIVDVLPSCKVRGNDAASEAWWCLCNPDDGLCLLQTVLGYEQDELVNRNLRSILHPHDVDYVMAHLENADSEDIEFTARYLKKGYVWAGGS